MSEEKKTPQAAVTIHTDGACLGNPGPGGYSAVLAFGDTRRELSGGFRLTTNNRMELLAVIEALTSLPGPSAVTLITDSRYVHDAIEKRWLASWQKKGWVNAEKKPVKNQDLWRRLLPLLATHGLGRRRRPGRGRGGGAARDGQETGGQHGVKGKTKRQAHGELLVRRGAGGRRRDRNRSRVDSGSKGPLRVPQALFRQFPWKVRMFFSLARRVF